MSKPTMKLPVLNKKPSQGTQAKEPARASGVVVAAQPLTVSDRFETPLPMTSGVSNPDRVASILRVIGSYFGHDKVRAEQLAGIAEETEQKWFEGNLAFYQVGEKLLEFEEIASQEGVELAMNSGEIFNIEKVKLSMLRTIARRVREKTLRIEDCPQNYTAVYHFAAMPLPLLERAKAENVLRPDIKVREILDWKKTANLRNALIPVATDDTELAVEIRKLERKRRSLRKKLTEIEVALEERQKLLVKSTIKDAEIADGEFIEIEGAAAQG